MKASLKKTIFAIIIAFLSLGAFAFGGKASDSQNSIVGYIKFYGNAPFEFPGFETVDGYVYTLKVKENSSFTLSELEKQTGNMLELTGEIDKSQKNGLNVLKDGIFIVSEWKKL